MRKKVQNTLLELGVTPNLKGFGYICDAVEIIAKEGHVKITYVYDKIAKNNKSTWLRVERTIRHAIEHVDELKWQSMGGTGYKNSEFLYTLELLIREENKDE